MTTVPYTSWNHKLARLFVRPMVGSGITPNHLTTARLLIGLAACAAFARFACWGLYGKVSGRVRAKPL